MEPENTPCWFSGVYMKLPIFLANQPKHYKNKHLLDLPHTVLNTMPRDFETKSKFEQTKKYACIGEPLWFPWKPPFWHQQMDMQIVRCELLIWLVALRQLKRCDPTALEENGRIWNSPQNWGFEVIFCFSLSCCLILLWGLSFFSGLPDGTSSHTSWPWAAKPVLHHHDKIHRHQTTSPSPGGSPGPGSGMPPVKSSTSPGATSGKPATNIPAKPAK